MIFALLAHRSDPWIDQAVAAAVPTAKGDDLAAIARFLLSRTESSPNTVIRTASPGLTALVSSFDRLPESIQEQILAQSDRLERPLRDAAALHDRRPCPAVTHATHNVLTILERVRRPALAYLAAETLITGREATHSAAAAVLDRMVQASLRPEPAWRPNADDLRLLGQAVTIALRRFDQHGQVAVLYALLRLLPHMDPAAASILDRPRHPATSALTDLLHRHGQNHTNDAPASLPVELACHGGLLKLLCIGSLRTVAGEALRGAAAAGHWDRLLASAWLLETAAIARPFADAFVEERYLPMPDAIVALPDETAIGAITWIARAGVAVAGRCERLAMMARLPQPAARLAAIRTLVDLTPPTLSATDAVAAAACPAPSLQALAAFAEDPEPALARAAVRELVQRVWSGLDVLMPKLLRSPHADVRKMAGDRIAPAAFDRFWSNFPHLAPHRRVEVGMALLKVDARFFDRLGARLAATERAQVLRAIAVARQLDRCGPVRGALLRLTRSHDAHIASAAVKALGQVRGLETQAVLESALEHRDPRVRANAVEALEQLRKARETVSLARLTHDRHQRPRANAIGAMLHVDPARGVEALRHMLADSRSPHRVSALWVSGQRRAITCATQVAEMSITDPDPAVRRRAADTLAQLIAAMRRGSVEPSRPSIAASTKGATHDLAVA